MRLFLLSLIVAYCAAESAMYAQDAPLPKPETQDPAPESGPTAPPLPIAPAPELIPADILPPPDPAAPAPALDIPTIEQLDEGLKPPPLSPAAESQRQHIEWRKLRNRVQNDAEVKAAARKAESARTDLDKRKLLARYYDVFYRKIGAIAPADMKAYLAEKKRENLTALPQPRVRPETALPTPTPAKPSASPALSASPSPTPPTLYGTPSPSPSKRGFGLPRP